MKEIEFGEIRTSQWLRAEHAFPAHGPAMPYTRLYVGKVSEVNQKWLKVKHGGHTTIVPQTSLGTEKFWLLTKKEAEEILKEHNDK